MRKGLLVALAVLAGFALLGFGASRLPASGLPVAPDLAVQQRLLCPQCQGVRLDVCDRPLCVDMRSDIRRRLAAGESQDSIVAAYEATYGPAVLAAAQPAGSPALVPWLFVGLGLLLLAFLAAGRARSGRAPGAGLPPEPAGGAGLVDRELAAWRSGR